MKKKILALALVTLVAVTAVFAAKPKTKAYDANDENWMWYEFKAKVFGRSFKFFAFKTDEQRDNRVIQLLNKNGWGMSPIETITEYFNEGAYKETVLFNEELKPKMKEDGYKYAFTTYKTTTKDNTTIYLYTFYYDAEKDVLYVQQSTK